MPYENVIQAQRLRLSAILKREFWVAASKLQYQTLGVRPHNQDLITTTE